MLHQTSGAGYPVSPHPRPSRQLPIHLPYLLHLLLPPLHRPFIALIAQLRTRPFHNPHQQVHRKVLAIRRAPFIYRPLRDDRLDCALSARVPHGRTVDSPIDDIWSFPIHVYPPRSFGSRSKLPFLSGTHAKLTVAVLMPESLRSSKRSAPGSWIAPIWDALVVVWYVRVSATHYDGPMRR